MPGGGNYADEKSKSRSGTSSEVKTNTNSNKEVGGAASRTEESKVRSHSRVSGKFLMTSPEWRAHNGEETVLPTGDEFLIALTLLQMQCQGITETPEVRPNWDLKSFPLTVCYTPYSRRWNSFMRLRRISCERSFNPRPTSIGVCIRSSHKFIPRMRLYLGRGFCILSFFQLTKQFIQTNTVLSRINWKEQ